MTDRDWWIDVGVILIVLGSIIALFFFVVIEANQFAIVRKND